MTNNGAREIYLNTVWKPYPSFAGKSQADYFCGRFKSSSNEKFFILGQDQHREVMTQQLSTGVDPDWGESCPVEALVNGDVVALDKSGRLFLLAPCLGEYQADQQARSWSNFLRMVEIFFLQHGFLHLKTPFLVTSPGVDHHIDYMTVKASRTGREWALPTSPEISLKKYLCQGYERIFEIKNCFRDDLPSPIHGAEFTMLEWYRSYASLDDIAEDIQSLLRALTSSDIGVERSSVSQEFKNHTGFDLTPNTSRQQLLDLVVRLEIDYADSDDWNDLFFRIFMEKVEPELGKDKPILLFDFPPKQASLSQINQQGWSSRFELYWRGVELANAYLEVNDPQTNIERFQAEEKLRQGRQANIANTDKQYFELLKQGMPPASGIALGLDRLYSLLKTN